LAPHAGTSQREHAAGVVLAPMDRVTSRRVQALANSLGGVLPLDPTTFKVAYRLADADSESVTTTVNSRRWIARRHVEVTPDRPALWAALVARVVRRDLRTNGMNARVPRPPRLGRWAGRGVAGSFPP
jgi:hypothetical protein